MFVDQIQVVHVLGWKTGIAKLIAAGHYAPTTANGWLAILRVITKAAKRELGLPTDVAEDVANFDTSEHATYTEEEPNALAPDKVSEFLACMREVYPQHYAMTFLGFATGLRPSSLRPLRRNGLTPDVRWDEGVILVRRSHSLGDEVMDTTKTKLRQRISVPSDVMEVLADHVKTQLTTPEQMASDLLFQPRTAATSSEHCLAPSRSPRWVQLIGRGDELHPTWATPDLQRPGAHGKGGGARDQEHLGPPDRPHARALLHGQPHGAAREHRSALASREAGRTGRPPRAEVVLTVVLKGP